MKQEELDGAYSSVGYTSLPSGDIILSRQYLLTISKPCQICCAHLQQICDFLVHFKGSNA